MLQRPAVINSNYTLGLRASPGRTVASNGCIRDKRKSHRTVSRIIVIIIILGHYFFRWTFELFKHPVTRFREQQHQCHHYDLWINCFYYFISNHPYQFIIWTNANAIIRHVPHIKPYRTISVWYSPNIDNYEGKYHWALNKQWINKKTTTIYQSLAVIFFISQELRNSRAHSCVCRMYAFSLTHLALLRVM